jgi:hypothetical protein
MASRDYVPNCDVLSITSYSSGSDGKDTHTPDGGGYGSEGEDLWTSYIVTPPTVAEHEHKHDHEHKHEHKHTYYPNIEHNDPLRYFLEHGEITPNEYERWKIVREEHDYQPRSKLRQRPDYGPGHNSDSDSDSDIDDKSEGGPTIEYGSGYRYMEQDNEYIDPWNPTPDTTHNRRYTKIATNGEFMIKRLVQDRKLGSSFGLKIIWERFATSSSQRLQTLQDFWQENTLQIYEALQDLMETQSVGGGGGFGATPASYEYHSMPTETLDNTFETIGRMSRCISEDFNTPSVVAYVEEFLVSLYREIEFSALVEEHNNTMREQRQ